MPVSGSRDQRIAEIAACQRGRIATRQLTAAGVGSNAVTHRVRSGRLFRVHRGVLVVGHPGEVPLGRETAALLAVGGDAALTGLSAAIVWNMIDDEVADGPIHITSSLDRRPADIGIKVHRSLLVQPGDVRIHRGLPVLSPARSLLDLAEQTSMRRTELAVDRGLVARVLTRADLWDVIERAPTRHGAKVLRQLIDDTTPTTITRSEAEEGVLDLIRAADLPAPRVNARVHGYEVDFYWPAHHLVLEVDGYRYHHTHRAFEHDRRKDASLQAAGITTMRTTWRQAQGEPYAVIARLALALGAATDRDRSDAGDQPVRISA